MGFYLALAFLMRGYLMWIISLTFADDRSLLLSLLYPSVKGFFVSLIIGAVGLGCFVLFSLKRFAATRLYQTLWRQQWLLIGVALTVDLAVQVSSGLSHIAEVTTVSKLALFINLYLLWFWLRSKTVKRFFGSWLTAHTAI
jgi:hypothetical protein